MLTFQSGLWYETLQWAAWEKPPEAVASSMFGDNVDDSSALAETEMSLVSAYFVSSRLAIPRQGSRCSRQCVGKCTCLASSEKK